MSVPSKDKIEQWIIPHLSVGSRGPQISVPLTEIVASIFYRLKTGCQWRELPIKQFFDGTVLTWNSVFQHFNKWSKAGCWQKVWVNFLKQNRQYLDLSSAEFDGSHTPAKNGGDAVGYQGRKASKTTNSLFMCDNQGVMLSMSTPQEGQHHDLYQIKELFDELCQLLKEAGIELEGLFLNADPGFDSDAFRQACEEKDIIANVKPNPRNSSKIDLEPYENGTHVFDEELYKDRYVIEHANAWIDGFKALLVRFEFSVKNWMSLHFMAFFSIFLRKLVNKNKL